MSNVGSLWHFLSLSVLNLIHFDDMWVELSVSTVELDGRRNGTQAEKPPPRVHVEDAACLSNRDHRHEHPARSIIVPRKKMREQRILVRSKGRPPAERMSIGKVAHSPPHSPLRLCAPLVSHLLLAGGRRCYLVPTLCAPERAASTLLTTKTHR